jgi:thioredoxin 1
MKQVSNQEFKNEVADFKGVVVADFYADWCAPCKMLSPMLEKLSEENTDSQVKYVKINVDQEQQLAGMFGIQGIPTVLVFKDGQIFDEKVGVAPRDSYLKAVAEAKEYQKPEGPAEVIVYTTPSCPYCHMVKSYFDDRKVAYTEIDVAKDEAAAMQMIERSGKSGVPQILINNQMVVGFNKPLINMLLNLN